MTRPRLLDLFSGAGGSAVGYDRAGFEVVGVDHLPQKRFPFAFVEADALEYVVEHGREFDAIHASPPCQAYSRLRHLPWLKGNEYWDSIPPTRAALVACNRPWVIENVEGAPLSGILLCGTMFGLRVYRHRLFEASFGMLGPHHRKHRFTIKAGRMFGSRQHDTNAAMGIDWMTRDELAQAIPPSYAQWVGKQLMRHLRSRP